MFEILSPNMKYIYAFNYSFCVVLWLYRLTIVIVLFIIRYKVGFILGTSEVVSEGLRKTNDCLTFPNISLSPTHKTLFHIIIVFHEEHLQPFATICTGTRPKI